MEINYTAKGKSRKRNSASIEQNNQIDNELTDEPIAETGFKEFVKDLKAMDIHPIRLELFSSTGLRLLRLCCCSRQHGIP